MFRKIAMIAVPAAAFALMVCAADNSSSQAFARGGRGGHGFHNSGHFRGYHNRYFGRYFGWGYPSYYGYDYPGYAYGTVYEPTAPVVTAAVTPVCSSCETGYSYGYPSYGGWGYGRYRNHFHGGFHGRGGHGRH
jgi:hypothetical protein